MLFYNYGTPKRYYLIRPILGLKVQSSSSKWLSCKFTPIIISQTYFNKENHQDIFSCYRSQIILKTEKTEDKDPGDFMTWLYITKIAISKWYLSAMLSSCVVVQPLMQYSQKINFYNNSMKRKNINWPFEISPNI